jgi:hypothetical protein
MMNLYIKNAIVLDPNGVKRRTPQVYVGAEIVFIDVTRHAKACPNVQPVSCVVRKCYVETGIVSTLSVIYIVGLSRADASWRPEVSAFNALTTISL